MIDAEKDLARARREMAEVHKSGKYDDEYFNKIKVTSNYDDMLKMMEKDGLINRKTGFIIKKSGNDLYINNVKQSKEVFNKYESMMDAKDLKISGSANHISINTSK